MAKEGFDVKPVIETESGEDAKERKTGRTYAD
jgi:hypothetical protein